MAVSFSKVQTTMSRHDNAWRVTLVSEQYAPDMSSTTQIFPELLRELLQNPAEAAKAGERARRYFEQHFALQISAAKYAKHIKELNRPGPASFRALVFAAAIFKS
jgi:glycosyltransferase involved in cell wall biosynthesis